MKNIIAFFLATLICNCSKSGNAQHSSSGTQDSLPAAFVKGADVSWVTEMESRAYHFFDRSGKQLDCFQLLKSQGINTIRLRVWVNPSRGWCSPVEMLNKAIRASSLGFQLLIDFHYSDYWADPGKQNKPASWEGIDFKNLQDSVYYHTNATLRLLKSKGIIPRYVQVGNETNDGMLWPDGKASLKMASFAALLKAGYRGVKDVDTSIKVILHLSNGFDKQLFNWMCDGLKANSADWDIIGMSVYPDANNWQTINSQVAENMNSLVNKYGKPVLICEAGMNWRDSIACRDFLNDLIMKNKAVTEGKGLGVIYWEPECYGNWQGYEKGAFDSTGKPSVAMDAFSN